MARDCEVLSPAAQRIFEKLKPFFPPGPFNWVNWQEEGIVIKNSTYDLRKAEDRKKLEEWQKHQIGFYVVTEAAKVMKESGSLDDFQITQFLRFIRKDAELAVLLEELDFQIETYDVIGETD